MKTSKKGASPRSVARLFAAQALYQLTMEDEPAADVVTVQYIEHRFGSEIEGDTYGKADEPLFSDIVKGSWDRREEWDGLIAANLSSGWTVARIDSVLLAILRAGVYELAVRPDVPTAVVINEYVDVTHAFFEGRETAFVNSVLDKVGKAVRS